MARPCTRYFPHTFRRRSATPAHWIQWAGSSPLDPIHWMQWTGCQEEPKDPKMMPKRPPEQPQWSPRGLPVVPKGSTDVARRWFYQLWGRRQLQIGTTNSGRRPSPQGSADLDPARWSQRGGGFAALLRVGLIISCALKSIWRAHPPAHLPRVTCSLS